MVGRLWVCDQCVDEKQLNPTAVEQKGRGDEDWVKMA